MSYLWSDKITDYYYSNPELDTVAVMWTDPEDGLVREHYIKVDETDEQWRDFVAEVPYDKIDERTMVRNEEFREQFREAFRNYSETHVETEYVDRTKPFEDIFIDFVSTYNKEDSAQKEQLFKFKLKVFELDIVKNSKSDDKFKNAKAFIRKAENPVDVLLGYMVFANGAELKMVDKEKFEVEGVYVPIK